MRFDDILLYLLSFVGIWFGAGLIIKAIDGVSRKLHISSFTLSFFVLGMLTSIPEFAVGLTAVTTHDPQIFVGNLLGGIPVLFLLVIPLLAVLGNGIKLTHTLSKQTLFITLIVIAIPSMFAIDQHITTLEAVTLLVIYILMFIFLNRPQRTANHKKSKKLLSTKSYSLSDMLFLLLGVIIVFTASQFIVDKTLVLSTALGISPFLVSLLILSLGTNLPELSIAIRSVFTGKRDIALGDYLGSAAANVFILGFLTLINQGEVITASNFALIFLFVIVGVGLFYIFSRSNRDISRKEGLLLLSLYLVFITMELLNR